MVSKACKRTTTESSFKTSINESKASRANSADRLVSVRKDSHTDFLTFTSGTNEENIIKQSHKEKAL